MYARILVAVDGSSHSDHALKHAVDLARSLSATVRIIHVVDIGLLPLEPELSIDFDALYDARRKLAEKTLAAARETIEASGITFEARLLDTATATQHVAAAIAAEAVSWPADVVVLGTHGRRGIERWLLGSVAEGVARRSTVPVLLVPMPE